MIGRSVAFATARKWAIVSRASLLYTIGGSTISPSAPSFAASAAHRHAPAVVYSATPVSTGTRLRTWATVALSSSCFSAGSSVVFSPTLPSMTSPCTPAASIASMWARVPRTFSA